MKNINKTYLINFFVLIAFLCVFMAGNVYAHKKKIIKKQFVFQKKIEPKHKKDGADNTQFFIVYAKQKQIV